MSTKTQATSVLPIMETFYTVQGEGFYTGSPAFFIRIAGCDVGCVWCDVKDSWDASKHPSIDVADLARKCLNSGTAICVVTGGEPAMHNLEPLTSALRAHGIRVNIETSGVYPLTGQWDWITFSPKKFKEPHPSVYQQANELKVIVNHVSDLAWAEQHAAKLNEGCLLYLQPEWQKKDVMIPLILDFIGKNTSWKISLQTHKWMGVD